MKSNANVNQIRETAEKIYRMTRVDENKIEIFGEDILRPINKASLEEIETWLANIAEAAKQYDIPEIDESKIEFTTDKEKILAIAAAKKKTYNKRAGVRALEKKYGHESAKRIVQKYSGRTIKD